jgi:hypothetical protein
MTLPVIVSADGSYKTTGLGTGEAKWVTATTPAAETLLQEFSSGSDPGIKQVIRNVLLAAEIPEEKINRIKITFTSSGTEELSLDKNNIFFREDFPGVYSDDRLEMITKLFRTRNVKMELTDEGSADFDKAVSSAISNGLRYGNKTESSIGNKMTIEAPALIYGFERSPITINRVNDSRTTVILGVPTDIGLNSIATLRVIEGNQNDFFIRIGSSVGSEPIEFNVNSEKRAATFRLSNGEAYSLTFFDKTGNKVTFSITGFKVNFE